MEWAFDMISQQDVNANDAVRASNRYTCPVCGAGCTLRKGYVRTPYFAHINGVASESCENYHPGGKSARDDNYAKYEFQSYPKLYIRTDSLLNWHLEILLYDYPLECGEIYINFGLYGEITIPIPQIRKGGIRLPIKIKDKYLLQTNEEVTPKHKKIICTPINGLDEHKFNVFYCSDDGGRRLHGEQTLTWGESYLIVWHSNLRISKWPQNSSLPQTQFNSNDQWLCKKIDLPSDQNIAIEKWVYNELNCQIKHPPFKLNTLFPIPDEIFDDGSLLISNTKFALFTIDRNTQSQDYDELVIVSDEFPNYKKMISLHRPMPMIFSLEPLPLGRILMWVKGNPDVNLILYHTDSAFNQRYIPGADFIFQDNRTDEIVSLPIFSPNVSSHVKKAIMGDVSLLRVSLPQRAKVSINFQPYLRNQSAEMCIFDGNNYEQIEAQLTKKIINLLGKGKILIDFGNYGKLEIDNRFVEGNRLTLTDSSRRKIKWILSHHASGEAVYQIGNQKNLAILKIIKESFLEDDYILIEKLMKKRLVPVFLLPYIRSVIQDVVLQLNHKLGRRFHEN